MDIYSELHWVISSTNDDWINSTILKPSKNIYPARVRLDLLNLDTKSFQFNKNRIRSICVNLWIKFIVECTHWGLI